eukprot:Nk52_evm92s158 gene=Nk52_evmTU92s158
MTSCPSSTVADAAAGKSLRPWTQPVRETNNGNGGDECLMLYNSLTRSKVPFVPMKGRQVLWYICGPTVYDVSHVGHAKNYLTFDIVRRCLEGYFNYEVLYVMNITDIDDKIILRARRNHLLAQYREGKKLVAGGGCGEVEAKQVLEDVQKAYEVYAGKFKGMAKDHDKYGMMSKAVAAIEKAMADTQAVMKTNPDQGKLRSSLAALVEAAMDPLSEMLDKEHGSKVTDLGIYAAHTEYYENDFLEDMKNLNIRPADCLTRVSEYVPEIVAFVEKIVANGFGYESNGSVYFDTLGFANHKDHDYAKLVPEAFGNAEALAEGEGELGAEASEKRSPNDFALWKASKPGEPFWDSPWGQGRPGWHIECSCMAGCIIGKQMDIHSGGVDLKFPHHDNELAQSEAHYENGQWVNYFLHGGHLEIEGKKMSKSLKNFTTIKEALESYTARQLRLMFLLHAWNAGLDYSKNTMGEALNFERIFNEFFMTTKAVLRETGSRSKKYTSEDLKLLTLLSERQQNIHLALLDNLDTAQAIKQLKEIVSEFNVYIRGGHINPDLLKKAAVYVTKMLRIFGCCEGNSTDTIGFGSADAGGNKDEVVMPFLEAFSTFRDEVRDISRTCKNFEMLNLCDKVRDDILPELGVKLEDREGAKAVVKLADKEALMREREIAKREEEQKAKKKAEAKRKLEEQKAKKEAQKKINPAEMFLNETSLYSKFDERGIPTHDSEGNELSKKKRKNAEKMFDQQTKLYAEYTASLKH